MSSKKFTTSTLNGLRYEIARRVNKTLNKEVAGYVKDKLKEHVKEDVYSTYSPTEYNRREENGGLLDDKNIRHKVKSCELSVYEEAPIEGPRLDSPNWVEKKDSLAQIIEHGAHNPWNSREYPWTKPRPFVTKTQEDINYRYAEILDILEKGVNHDTGTK